MKNLSVISLSLLTLILLAGVVSLNAQTSDAAAERCSVTVDAIAEGSGDEITGITGKAISVDAEEVIQGVSDGKFLIFNGLANNARYSFSIRKPGFKRTLHERTINCSPDMRGKVSLVRGNATETYNSFGSFTGVFKIGDVDKIKSVDADSSATAISRAPGARPGVDNSPANGQVTKIVSKGVINGSAISLPKPGYPASAKAVNANGALMVQVTIDEEGNVIAAAAVSGHPLLRAVCVEAARGARFKPTLLEGSPVKVSGIIVYNFQ